MQIAFSTLALGIALSLLWWQPVKAAIPGAAGDGTVSPAFGSYGASIKIDAPPFHDLQPDLRLVYNSAGGSTLAGNGWTLNGISYFERVGEGGGTPSYDSTDEFTLDGGKLLTSTALGGTHVTQNQSYLKIQRDDISDKWYVWEKDGTKKTYEKEYQVNVGGTWYAFRWALSSVQDTSGNTVNYTYWSDANDGHYLDTVTYADIVIKFWRELRPDPRSYANGVGQGSNLYRLKTVQVKVGNNSARAYKLTYQTSNNSGRSLLTNVQEYGSDVVLDSSGTILGGTANPETAMAYSNPSTALFPSGQTRDSTVSNWDLTWKYQLSEISGDGKLDAVVIYKNANDGKAHAFVRLGDGSGGFSTSAVDSLLCNWDTTWSYQLVDVNGDGMQDSVTFYKSAADGKAHTWVRLASGAGGFSTTAVDSTISDWDTTWKYQLSDVSGDGTQDVVVIYKKASDGKAHAWVRLGDGSGAFGTSGVDSEICNWDTTWLYQLSDLNGDGMQDSVTFYKSAADGKAHAWVRLATGTGAFSATGYDTAISTWNTTFTYTTSDINGDGKQDAVVIYKNAADGLAHAWVKLSNGTAFNQAAFDDVAIGTFDTDFQYQLADVNGDGIQDIVDIYQKASDGKAHAWVKFGTPAGFNSWGIDTAIGTWDSSFKYLLADLNGDGRTDIADIYKSAADGTAHAWVKLSESATTIVPDMMVSMTNGLGGTTSIAYLPASVWPSQYKLRGGNTPTVSQVVVDDGRGNSGVNTFSYADAQYSPIYKAFFGFRYHKVVINDQGTYVETLSRQTPQSIGQADAVYTKNSAGNIYASSTFTYAESGDGVTTPYTSQIASASQFENNLSASARQNRTNFTYDSYGNQTQIADEGDVSVTGDEVTKVITYNYNPSAYIVSAVSAEQTYSGTTPYAGNKTEETLTYYDGASSTSTPPTKGLVTRSDRWNNQTGGYTSATSAYDAYGNSISTTDALGHTSSTVFDPIYHQYPVSSTNPMGQTTTQTWDYVKGSVLSATDCNGSTSSISYDALGRVISQTDPAGQMTTTQYFNIGDPNSQRIRNIAPDGSTDGLWTDIYKDGLGRVYKSVREGPSSGVTYIQEAVYADASSNPVKTSLWYQNGGTPVWENYVYDGIGRMTKTIHADGSFATVTYAMDSSGKPYTIAVDELGAEHDVWVNTDNQVVQVREKNRSASQDFDTFRTYDSEGRLIQVKDAYGHLSTSTYNSLGQVLSSTDPDMGTTTATYDAVGNLLTTTDVKGQTTALTYDAGGRLTSKTVGGQVTNYYYDESGHGASVGRPTRVVYPGGSVSTSYDAFGRTTSLTQTIGSTAKTVTKTYDTLGRTATITYPDGEVVTNTYGTDGSLVSVSGYVNSMTYGPNGNLTQMVYANGTSTNYAYDPNRLWLNSANVTKNGVTLYTASYTYNALQQVTSMTQGTPSALTTSYSYDDLGRLLSVGGSQNQNFSYDAIGNMTYNSSVGNYLYDAAHPHAATTAGSATYTYDAVGNMTSGNGRTLTWDAQNRLSSVTQASGTTTFAYGDGTQRVSKTNGANTTQYFLGGLLDLVNGSPTQYYYAGSMLVAKKDSSGNKSWYHADRLGSVRLMTNSSGAEVKDYDYRPFGEVLTTTGSLSNERGFTGQTLDAETGLMYYNARYYDPKLARFISADTAVADESDPQDLNAYSYCMNNPVNATDPSGHKWVLAGYKHYTVYTNETVIEHVARQVQQTVSYVASLFYWQEICPARTWHTWFGTYRTPAVYVPAYHFVTLFKKIWVTVVDTVRRIVRVAHDAVKAIYKEVKDDVKRVVKTAVKVGKSVVHHIAAGAKSTWHWMGQHKQLLATIGIIVGLAALTLMTGGLGAFVGGAILTRIGVGMLSAGITAGIDMWKNQHAKPGEHIMSNGEIAADAAEQGAIGFLSVGLGQSTGALFSNGTKLVGVGESGWATKGALTNAGFGFMKDLANNWGNGKSDSQSVTNAALCGFAGMGLNAAALKVPGGWDNGLFASAGAFAGTAWALGVLKN